MNGRIEIYGGIGSGKSTMARILSEHGFIPLMERFALNPFWESFYTSPTTYAFETEITFLLQHYHEIKRNYKINGRIVCDYCFYLDLAYAEIGLSNTRLAIFKNIFSEVLAEVGYPSLILYLDCPPEIQLERIRKRERKEEGLITLEFLDALNKQLNTQILSIPTACQVITINSNNSDYLHSYAAQNLLLNKINDSLLKINL